MAYRPGGYTIITDPDAPTIEYDTFTCGHCQFIVPLKPHHQPTTDTANGWCWHCTKPLCPSCANRLEQHGCEIWEKQMERIEARDRLARTVLGG